MLITKFNHIGIFNTNGLTQFEDLLKQPLDFVKKEISNITSNINFYTKIECNFEVKPLETRLQLAESLYLLFESNPVLSKYKTDKGFWSWLAAIWLPVLFENSPKSAKLGEQARWILDKQKAKYYRHLLAGPYFIYNHHYPNPEKALSILGGSIVIPGELVGQIAATSDIAFSVGAEVATILYIDPLTGKPKKGASGLGAGSARRLSAAYLNQIDLTLDYRGMNATEIIRLLPEEFSRFKQ
jgi:hypothetical protein